MAAGGASVAAGVLAATARGSAVEASVYVRVGCAFVRAHVCVALVPVSVVCAATEGRAKVTALQPYGPATTAYSELE